jgi:hypothetical protein
VRLVYHQYTRSVPARARVGTVLTVAASAAECLWWDMSTSSRIAVSLSRDWQVVQPEQAGVTGVAFMAMHQGTSDAGFTANITVDGRGKGASLTEVADDAVQRIEQSYGEARVVDRAELTGDGLVQLLDFSAAGRALRQRQAFLPLANVVLQVVLTTTPGQYEDLVVDFESFVQSVRPATGDKHDDNGVATTGQGAPEL